MTFYYAGGGQVCSQEFSFVEARLKGNLKVLQMQGSADTIYIIVIF